MTRRTIDSPDIPPSQACALCGSREWRAAIVTAGRTVCASCVCHGPPKAPLPPQEGKPR